MAIWHYETRRLGASVLAPGGYAYDYRSYANPAGASISSLSASMVPGATLNINLSGYTQAPDTVTFGGVALTINSATTSVVSVTLPANGSLPLTRGVTHTLSVESIAETATSSVILNSATGWNFINLASVPDVAFDSLHRARAIDGVAPFTAEVADQFWYEEQVGLSFTTSSIVLVADGAAPLTFQYIAFDVSTSTIYAERGVTVEVSDGTPASFSFTNVTGATVSTLTTSNTIVVAGFNTSVLVTIAGDGSPEYSIDGGAYTNVGNNLTPGQTLTIRNTSDGSPSGSVSTTVTVGGVPYTWSIANSGAVSDTTPDAFVFTDVTDAALSAVQTSNTITVAGIDAASPISIAGGTYSINGGTYTASAGTVTNGQTVAVRLTSSGSFSTAVSATLTIGGVSDTYTATTLIEDTVPTAFDFTDVTDATVSTEYTSDPITVAGINSSAPISVTGGTYSLDGGSFVSTPGTVTNGQQVRARLSSSGSPETGVTCTVTIGGVSGGYTVTNAALVADTVPSAFSFVNRSSATESISYVSNLVIPVDYNTATAITIIGGEYSINGAGYVSTPGTLSPDQSLRLRVTSAAGYPGSTSATVTLGGVDSIWTVTNYTSAPGGGSTYYGLKGVLKGELRG